MTNIEDYTRNVSFLTSPTEWNGQYSSVSKCKGLVLQICTYGALTTQLSVNGQQQAIKYITVMCPLT